MTTLVAQLLTHLPSTTLGTETVGAEPSFVPVWLGIINLVLTSGISIVLFRLQQNVSRFDRLDDKREDLEKRLHEAATKLIDERIRGVTHQLDSHAQAVMLRMDEISKRLQSGDVYLSTLRENDHGLKDWFQQNAAMKSDLAQHEEHVGARMDKIEGKMGTLAETVAVLNDRTMNQPRVQT